MAPTPEQLNAVADWLDECEVCNKRHEFIWKNPNNARSGGTWASPDDGHAYFRRSYMMSSTKNNMPDALRRAAAEMAEVKV